jgi:hypothetical protein
MHRGRSENFVEHRSALARGVELFPLLLGNFLDQFYSAPSIIALSAEPAYIRHRTQDLTFGTSFQLPSMLNLSYGLFA